MTHWCRLLVAAVGALEQREAIEWGGDRLGGTPLVDGAGVVVGPVRSEREVAAFQRGEQCLAEKNGVRVVSRRRPTVPAPSLPPPSRPCPQGGTYTFRDR